MEGSANEKQKNLPAKFSIEKEGIQLPSTLNHDYEGIYAKKEVSGATNMETMPGQFGDGQGEVVQALLQWSKNQLCFMGAGL